MQQGWDSLRNSINLGLIGALIGGLLGMVIAYITAKRNYFGKRFIEISSVLMFSVPGTVLGISYILGFAKVHGITAHHIRQADTLEFAKAGTMERALDKIFRD